MPPRRTVRHGRRRRGAVRSAAAGPGRARAAVGWRGAREGGRSGPHRTGSGCGGFGGFLVGDEAAVLKGDDTVRDACRFLGVAGGGEDGAALRGVAAQQAVQPGRLTR